MRASTRRRITLALIGLLVLVLIGWLVQDAFAAGVVGQSLWRDGAGPIMLLSGNTNL